MSPNRWHKSSYSPNQGTRDCVEVMHAGNTVSMRDSKLGDDSPILTVTADQWRAIIGAIRAGELRG